MARKSKKTQSDTMDDLSNYLVNQIDAQEILAEKQMNQEKALFDQLLEQSNLKDKRLELLLKEQSDATGEYGKRVRILTEAYLQEQKEKGNIGKRDLKKIDKILEQQDKLSTSREVKTDITKRIEKEKDLINPLNAFKFAFEDFTVKLKDTGSKWGALKKGTSTLGSGLMESAKQQLTFKNLSKGLLHAVGVGLDLPALNILASEIGSDIKDRQEVNSKQLELQERLVEVSEPTKKGVKSVKDSEVLTNSGLFAGEEQNTLVAQEIVVDAIGKLENVTKSMHDELSDDLIDIYTENTKLNDLFRESLYMSKDQQDDIKKSIEAQQEPKDEIDIKPIEDQLKELIKTTKESSSTTAGGGILGDLFGSGDKGKGSPGKGKAGPGVKGKLGGIGSKVSGIASKIPGLSMAGKIATPLAMATAGYDKYTEVADDESLTTAQKTTKVGSTATGAGAGALAGAALGATVGSAVPVVGTLIGGVVGGAIGGIAGSSVGSAIGDYISGFMGDKDATTFVNGLAGQGIVKTSMIGDSQIMDWNVVKEMTSDQLKLLIKYDDWDDDTLNLMNQVLEYRIQQEMLKPAPVSESFGEVFETKPQVTSKPQLPNKDLFKGESYSMEAPRPQVTAAPTSTGPNVTAAPTSTGPNVVKQAQNTNSSTTMNTPISTPSSEMVSSTTNYNNNSNVVAASNPSKNTKIDSFSLQPKDLVQHMQDQGVRL